MSGMMGGMGGQQGGGQQKWGQEAPQMLDQQTAMTNQSLMLPQERAQMAQQTQQRQQQEQDQYLSQVLPPLGSVEQMVNDTPTPQMGGTTESLPMQNPGVQQQQMGASGQGLPQQGQQGAQQQGAQQSDWSTMFGLSGSAQEPNALLRMSEGYNRGGLLGALGMLMTKM